MPLLCQAHAFFFQAFCYQWHSRKVFQEGFVPLYCKPCVPQNRGHVTLYCRPCATTAADLVLLFCMLRAKKTAHPELQECMPCAAVPVPLNCRTSAASLQILCGSSIVLVCYTAGPVPLHCRPCAVTAPACCCHNAGPMNLQAVTCDILDG